MPFGSEQPRKNQMLGTTIHQLSSAIECEVQFYLLYGLYIEFVTPSTLITMEPAALVSKQDNY